MTKFILQILIFMAIAFDANGFLENRFSNLENPVENSGDYQNPETQQGISADQVSNEAESIRPEGFPVIFRSFDRATLSSQVTSTVKEITHRMGEFFQKDELLILLDDAIFQGLLFKARGSLAKAEAELSSKEKLFRQDIASIFELKTAQANVAIATSDLISAQHAVDACHIRAPYNGKVVQVMVEIAELIQEGKPLIDIVNDEQLIGQVLLPALAENLKKISLNKPVKIELKELEETVTGKILRISPVIDPASSLIKIDIVVENSDGNLRAGMIGSVIFDEGKSEHDNRDKNL